MDQYRYGFTRTGRFRHIARLTRPWYPGLRLTPLCRTSQIDVTTTAPTSPLANNTCRRCSNALPIGALA